jgi:uncharacterized integral membrane protein
MIVVGFVLLVAAVVVAIALIVQNPGVVTVHAFSWSRDVEMRWLVVAGLALTAIGLLGLAMMRVGGARHARLRRERKALAVENKRLVRQAHAADVPPVTGEPRYTVPASTASTAPPGASASTVPRGSAAWTASEQRASVGHSAPGPAAPSTGAVAAPGRPSGTSTEPHGIRERLVAKMHRRSKG